MGGKPPQGANGEIVMVRQAMAFCALSLCLLILVQSGFSQDKPIGTPTLESLKRRFSGRVELDKTTGRVTLSYSFANKNHLEDFTPQEGIRFQRAGITLPVGAVLRHKASWSDLRVVTSVMPANPHGTIIQTTDKIELVLGKPTTTSNKVILQVSGKNQSQQSYKLKDVGKRPIPVDWQIDDQKTSLNFGTLNLGTVFPKPFDKPRQIEFLAEKGEVNLGALKLSGKLDAKWLAIESDPEEIGSDKKGSKKN